MAIFALRQQLSRYDHANPGVLWGYCGGSECKILVDPFQSERHPDLAVYKTSPPTNDDSVWSIWVPEIVIEVVAPNSVERDYHEKPEEYLAFGVREYWVIDPERKLMEAHLRSGGGWLVTTIKPPKKHKSIMLPGFRLDLAKVLAAAATPPKPKR
jgi:Uma2 family endonuclease